MLRKYFDKQGSKKYTFTNKEGVTTDFKPLIMRGGGKKGRVPNGIIGRFIKTMSDQRWEVDVRLMTLGDNRL